MGFLAPWFLGGLAAVGLPIYFHLLKRHKTVPLPFSSLMFFERRTQSSVKHRRLQYLLLFALRALFIILLMLAFARPFIHSSAIVSAQGGRTVIVAIDNSFSMHQGDRLARAKTEATAFLKQLHGGDRAEIIGFASQTHLLTQLTNDHGALRNAIESIELSDGASSYADLTRELRSIAQPLHHAIEVHLFSDMQKSSMPASFSDLQLANNIKLIAHPLADKTIPNFTIEGVIAPRHIYDPKRVRIQATIAGFGTPAAHTTVSLLLNNKPVATKQADIPANGRVSVEFLAPEAPYGLNRGEIKIQSADTFPADDHFYFSTERSDPRPALFVQDPRDTRAFVYFRTALESSNEPAFTLVAASPDQAANLTLSKYAFVVLSDPAPPTRGFESNLRDYARAGGSIFIALGRQSANRGTVPVADLAITNQRYETPDAGRFNTVTYLDKSHPIIRRANQWEGIKFFHTVQIQPGASSRVIAKLADNSPLLTETKIGEGRVLTFASTFDNVSNDLPISPSFLPFVEQASHYLGNIDDRPATYAAGSYLDLRSSRDQAGSVEVSGPKGERVLSLSEAAKAQGVTLATEGFYDVRRPSGVRELAAVNPDRKESNLETIPAETLQLWENTGEAAPRSGGPAQTAANTEPRTVDFWWYVMIAALILAIAESLLGNRYLGVEKEAA